MVSKKKLLLHCVLNLRKITLITYISNRGDLKITVLTGLNPKGVGCFFEIKATQIRTATHTLCLGSAFLQGTPHTVPRSSIKTVPIQP